jgi:2-oxoglutarate dehydrogenase E2 component (dihydrolipoamide succinyltransferase)
MSVELKIPSVGESITEVQISNWLKAEGDLVQTDEPVAVIDSEKTTFELPAPGGGRLTRILHQAGDTVSIGAVIGYIEPGDSEKAKPAEKKAPRRAADTSAPPPKASKPPARAESDGADSDEPLPKRSTPPANGAPPPVAASGKPSSESPAKPAATGAPKSPAAQGPEAKPAAEREEKIVPMTMLRRTVARRLVEARQAMAMLTTFNEVDMSAVLSARKEHQEDFLKRYEVKLGLMSFFVKAAIGALKEFPQLNAEIRGDDIVYRNYFDIAVAIATDRGLVVPVLRHSERQSFAEIEKAIADFAQRAKTAQLKPEELEGGTFTITNGGVFGSLLSTPIINPPQTGILGMHSIQERPVAIEQQIVIRPMMYLALTYDHRLVDGREAVLFLRRIKETLEAPVRLLIEI